MQKSCSILFHSGSRLAKAWDVLCPFTNFQLCNTWISICEKLLKHKFDLKYLYYCWFQLGTLNSCKHLISTLIKSQDDKFKLETAFFFTRKLNPFWTINRHIQSTYYSFTFLPCHGIYIFFVTTSRVFGDKIFASCCLIRAVGNLEYFSFVVFL